MFREMRRKKQLLSEAETIDILKRCTSGVLAVQGDEDYPYAVPLSYAYTDGKLFFHLATEGHKLDGITRNNKVSFCVVDKDDVQPATYTTHFRSVIVFGRARVLTGDEEKRHALERLLMKYSPDFFEKGRPEIEKEWNRVNAVEVVIDHMTGKAAMGIVTGKSDS
jgi:nitroimidazol reductase NimA-like FMN-containing flavoprotein (pyridoxamine 5'-phosphate oxidase superfamily)